MLPVLLHVIDLGMVRLMYIDVRAPRFLAHFWGQYHQAKWRLACACCLFYWKLYSICPAQALFPKSKPEIPRGSLRIDRDFLTAVSCFLSGLGSNRVHAGFAFAGETDLANALITSYLWGKLTRSSS
jgi:hypothetical protein